MLWKEIIIPNLLLHKLIMKLYNLFNNVIEIIYLENRPVKNRISI